MRSIEEKPCPVLTQTLFPKGQTIDTSPRFDPPVGPRRSLGMFVFQPHLSISHPSAPSARNFPRDFRLFCSASQPALLRRSTHAPVTMEKSNRKVLPANPSLIRYSLICPLQGSLTIFPHLHLAPNLNPERWVLQSWTDLVPRTLFFSRWFIRYIYACSDRLKARSNELFIHVPLPHLF